MSKLSIIIVNWKVRDLLDKCLKSIFKYKKDYPIDVYVVDNDSRDGSDDMIRDNYQQVNLITLDNNIGFGSANNLAIKKSQADYFFLLNPDTELTESFFDKLFSYLKDNNDIGILAPQIVNADGSKQLSIRRNPSFWDQALVMLKMINVWGNNPILNRYLCKNFDYSKEQSVEQVMGAAMIINHEVFDKIGLFDEKFFIWFEEVDLCKRASQAGFDIRYYPGIKLIHHGGESFSQANSLKKQIIFNRSLLYYFSKHKNFILTFFIFLLTPINFILTLIYVIFLKNKRS